MTSTSSSRGPLHRRRLAAFTLIEVLVTIGIIMLLMGMLFPIVRLVQEGARKPHAELMVRSLHMALLTYSAEDTSRRFPPAEPDLLIRRSGNPNAPRLIDLLMPAYINAGIEELSPDQDHLPGQLLLDPWGRAYRYRPEVVDGAVQRPDPARTDWNGRNREPFGYVWSLGKPVRGGTGDASDPDGLPGSGAPWIYVSTPPADLP